MFIAALFTIAKFIDRQLDKEDMVYIYHGFLLYHKKE